MAEHRALILVLRIEKNILKEVTIVEKEKELLPEEVNVYVNDCGATKLKCNTDCPFGLPLLSTDN